MIITKARLVYLASLAIVPTFAAAQVNFQGIGFLPGGSESSLNAVSRDGSAVVGSALDSSGNYNAATWTSGGGLMALATLSGGNYSVARAVTGNIVVGFSNDGDGNFHAVTWTNGVVSSIAGPSTPAPVFAARDISADGSVIVGRNGNEAFRYTVGTGLVGLGQLNGSFSTRAEGVSADGTVLTGFAVTGTQTEAFRWTSGTGMIGLGDLPGGDTSSIAYGISSSGTYVVGLSGSAAGTEAMIWTAGNGMVGLGDLAGGSFESSANAVSNNGVVVGYGRSASAYEAIFWTAGTGMVSLNTYLTAQGVDLAGWNLSTAMGISDDGSVIAGYGDHNGTIEGFLITGFSAIPEPSTWALVAGCSCLVAVISRRFRRTN